MLSDNDYGTGWTTDESWFDSRQGQEFFFYLQSVHSDSGTCTVSCFIVPRTFSPRVKLLQRGLATRIHPLPRLRMSEAIAVHPIYFYGLHSDVHFVSNHNMAVTTCCCRRVRSQHGGDCKLLQTPYHPSLRPTLHEAVSRRHCNRSAMRLPSGRLDSERAINL